MTPPRYKYTVITRQNTAECHLDPRFWLNHPDWNFMVRTNIRHPSNPTRWLSGGGVTLEEAIAAAEFSLRQMVFQPHPILPGIKENTEPPIPLVGEESDTIIMNRQESK